MRANISLGLLPTRVNFVWKLFCQKIVSPLMFLEITSDLISGDSRDVLHEYIRKCENKFMCFLCEFSSTNRVHVLNHVESVHFPGSYKYQCDYCPKVLNTKNAKNVHMSRFHKNWDILLAVSSVFRREQKCSCPVYQKIHLWRWSDNVWMYFVRSSQEQTAE